MFIKNLNLKPFFFPDDIDTTKDDLDIIGQIVDGKDDKDLDKLGKDKDKNKDDKLDDDKEYNDDDLDLDNKDDELDLEHKDDDDEDVLNEEEKENEINNSRGLDFKKLREKNPEFAKTEQFKLLRDAYFREGKYTELFPTIEDATEAAENNETFGKLNYQILTEGSVEGLLESVKAASPEALQKISENFLGTLSKLDDNLYINAITPVVKNIIRKMHLQGKKALSKDENSQEGKALAATARNMWKWAFPNDDDDNAIDKADVVKSNEPSQREKDLSAREQKLEQDKYTGAFTTVGNSVDKRVNTLIDEGLEAHKLNDFTKDVLIEKIKSEVEKQIQSDDSHMKRMQSLWKRAKDEGYSNPSLSRIATAYLERVKPIIPSIRTRLVRVALGGKKNDDTKDVSIRAPRGQSGKHPSNDGKQNLKLVDSKKVDYKNTSDEDILSGRVKLKA